MSTCSCSWGGRLILLYSDWEKGGRYDSETGGHMKSITVSDGTDARALGPAGHAPPRADNGGAQWK